MGKGLEGPYEEYLKAFGVSCQRGVRGGLTVLLDILPRGSIEAAPVSALCDQ